MTNINYPTSVQRRIAEILSATKMSFSYDEAKRYFTVENKFIIVDDEFNPQDYDSLKAKEKKDLEIIIFNSDGSIMGKDKSNAHIALCRECNKFSFIKTKERHCPVCKKTLRYLTNNSKIPGWYGHTEVTIIDEDEASEHLKTLPDDVEGDVRQTINKIMGKVKYITVTQEKIQQMESLKIKYPNMEEVIDYFIENLFSSSFRKNKDIDFKPVLLVGSPGCGKTSFTSDAGRIMNEDYVQKIDLGNDIASFTLAGSDPSYSRARTGIIVEAMAKKDSTSPTKNPIIHFDELDKINPKHSYSAENVFLALLEKNTAKRFFDNYIGVNIDASGVNYIFTANSIEPIPAPVLNRLKVFKIPDYTYDQLKNNVLDYFYEGWISSNDMDASFLPEKLSDYIKERILEESQNDPRSIYGAITRLFTRTITKDPESNHRIALFSPDELYEGWKKFRGKRKIAPTTWELPKGFATPIYPNVDLSFLHVD